MTAWRKGEPKSDKNAVPVKLIDAITGEPVDLAELFGSISVDVGDISLGSITIKDGASGDLAAVDAFGRVSVDGSSVTQPISAAALPLPGGASTAANQTTIISALGDIVTNTTGLATEAGQVAQQAALEDIVTAVQGTLTIAFAAPQHAIIDNTVTITGALTDTQLRASAVPISGAISFTVPQHVIIDSGTVAVTGPLTDTQLRATPVPVSGSVTATIAGDAASNGSVALTTGGTAQDLFASATPTNGYLIVNPDANEILWLNEGADAVANGTGCIPIFPLGGYETPPLYKPYGRVSVVAATTGHKITARKW